MTNTPSSLSIHSSHSEQELEQTTQQVIQLALLRHQSGQIKAAQDLYLEVLEILPNHAETNHRMGQIAAETGQAVEAVSYFEVALNAQPERPEHWLSYIDALLENDQLPIAKEALELGRQHGLEGEAVDRLAARLKKITSYATDLKSPKKIPGSVPKSGEGNQRIEKKHKNTPSTKESNKLLALLSQGRFTEAQDLAKLLSIRFPTHGLGWKVLGALYQAQSQLDDAFLCMSESVRLSPDDAEAIGNLGTLLFSMNRTVEAKACLNRALALKPDYADAFCTLGAVLIKEGRFWESEEALNNALHLNPNSAKAYSNLGTALLSQSKITQAKVAYERAREFGPLHAHAYSNLLFCMSHDVAVTPQQLFNAHLDFSAQFETPLRAAWKTHSNSRDPRRCLQIGFVSADLHDHAVASFLEPILAPLAEKHELSLHAYYTHDIEDSKTQRLRSCFAHWHVVSALNDAQLAEKIRADSIDILIDLSGHTGNNRLLTFARKPAPIQASWMGYPGTTGLQAMDYYFSDKFFLPPGKADWQFTEKIFYLPTSSVFQPDISAPDINRLPALDNGHITFGSFNRDNKINDAVIRLFALVLKRVPNARLIMAGIDPTNQSNFAEQFRLAGIHDERLTFYPRTNMHAYLKLHHFVDVCLDTFPYGGGTTTFHAAYMGVPTLSLAGETPASRSGASILGRLGLNEFVATSIDSFVEKSAQFMEQTEELSRVRETMRVRFNASELGQPNLLSQHINTALRIAWKRWCVGAPAETTTITPS